MYECSCGKPYKRLKPFQTHRAICELMRLSKNSQQDVSHITEMPSQIDMWLALKSALVQIDVLKNIGVNINTIPVLDIRRKGASNIIGNRSFSEDSEVVSKIGKYCVQLYNNNKIGTVIKHIPGHGLATNDSHYKLSVIKSKKKQLIKNDFKPFTVCQSHFAMTAHLVYSAYDSNNTATHSKIVINKVIRKHIGFKGLLISDDISMKALTYGIKNNAIKALDAGCNIVLHCNGNIVEMNKLAKVIPTIDTFTQKKTSHFYKFLG